MSLQPLQWFFNRACGSLGTKIVMVPIQSGEVVTFHELLWIFFLSISDVFILLPFSKSFTSSQSELRIIIAMALFNFLTPLFSIYGFYRFVYGTIFSWAHGVLICTAVCILSGGLTVKCIDSCQDKFEINNVICTVREVSIIYPQSECLHILLY